MIFLTKTLTALCRSLENVDTMGGWEVFLIPYKCVIFTCIEKERVMRLD